MNTTKLTPSVDATAGSSKKARPSTPTFKKRRLLYVLIVLIGVYLMIDWLGKRDFIVQQYVIEDARIQDEIRIALISDLHASLWGEGQGDLLAALAAEEPHAVVLDGDLFDMRGKPENTMTLLYALADAYTCYFIPGNHEYQTNDFASVEADVAKAGIPILSGDSVLISSGDTSVELFGIDDGWGGKKKQLQQIADAAAARSDDVYSIMAIHVPNAIESYLQYGFDLTLCGHTHGGQFRIPGILNGLYAPGQGLFPKYGGGRYDFDDQTLIISRGLSKKPYLVPRIFNPAELVIVTLKGID
jgi:predicted MPP superfamily phosphohydrolase